MDVDCSFARFEFWHVKEREAYESRLRRGNYEGFDGPHYDDFSTPAAYGDGSWPLGESFSGSDFVAGTNADLCSQGTGGYGLTVFYHAMDRSHSNGFYNRDIRKDTFHGYVVRKRPQSGGVISNVVFGFCSSWGDAGSFPDFFRGSHA